MAARPLRTRIAEWLAPELRSGASWTALEALHGSGPLISARAAENLAVVTACVQAIASALASLPVGVYRREAGRRVEVADHALLRLYSAGVNEQQTWPDFLELLTASALLTGNGLAEVIVGADGRLEGLRFIPWNWVTVSQLANGRLVYDVSEQVGNMGRIGRTRRLLQGEVIHLRDRSDDGLVGRSRLSRASEAVQSAMTAHTFARNFLDKGAHPSGVISHPGAIGAEARDRLRKQFEDRHAGSANAGRALILDGGLTFTAMQVSPEDAELLETRKFGVEEMCRLYQVPPPLVQDYSHNTFTNSETAGRWFAQFTLGPWARKIEAEFARSVFPAGSGYELELDLSGFLRGDPATRWSNHAVAVTNDILTRDEVREIEGFNPRGDSAGAPQGA